MCSWPGRKKRCNLLLDLLKKFQSCRGHLSSSLQRAEQAVNEQASYMSKDYLQRTVTKVIGRKRSVFVYEHDTNMVPLVWVCLFRSLISKRNSPVLGKELRR